jgi:hypothetical protein
MPIDPQVIWDREWGEIVAKAWADDDFKKRLMADPLAVLKALGMKVTPGIKIQVVEETPSLRYLTLPPKPTGNDLSEEELVTVTVTGGGIRCIDVIDYGKGQRLDPHQQRTKDNL